MVLNIRKKILMTSIKKLQENNDTFFKCNKEKLNTLTFFLCFKILNDLVLLEMIEHIKLYPLRKTLFLLFLSFDFLKKINLN